VVAERIAEVSLQNPEYGARRLLPLLEKDGILISASALYSILKRRGLQNRSLRLLQIEAQRTVEIPPLPDVAMPPPIEEEAEQVQPDIDEKIPLPRVLPVPKASEKTIVTRPRILTLVNILLLALLLSLGFYTVQNVRSARIEPEVTAAVEPALEIAAPEPKFVVRPIAEYQTISERNLFNISKEKPLEPKKEIVVETIAPAEKKLGLKLVGTVVADNPKLSRAFIDNRSTRKQEAYRVGDQAGDVLIKKILRNTVIITTQEGDKLLTVEIEETKQGSRARMPGKRSVGETLSPMQIPSSQPPSARTRSISLDRQDVESSLADPDRFLEEIAVSPYMQNDQPSGFRISRIPPRNFLRKMGLRSRDIITGVNDQQITSPDQAAEVFEKLVEGGEVTITIKRRRRTRKISLNIQ